jgi:hypothetical protein
VAASDIHLPPHPYIERCVSGMPHLPRILIVLIATTLISASCSAPQDQGVSPARTPILTLRVIPLTAPTVAEQTPAATPSAPPSRAPTSAPSSNADNAYTHLYTVMDKHASGGTLRLLDSYEATAAWDDGDIAWVYDNALAMLALMARGTSADWQRAGVLADSIIYAQDHDPAFADGRLRDAYSATALAGANGKAKIAATGSATGNMAWAIVALLGYWREQGGDAYLNAASRLGQWIYTNTNDTRGVGGYTGGYSDSLAKNQWKSTEHNLDVYVAFVQLQQATGDAAWLERAGKAKTLIQSMWDPVARHFWTGTTDDGVTINHSPIPEDVQSWAVLALGKQDGYGAGVAWAEQNLAIAPCTPGAAFSAFKFSDTGSGCWFEGAAHMAVAAQALGETAKADAIVQSLRAVQVSGPNNNQAGIVAADAAGADTGFGWSYPPALHIGATAWYLFAERKYNPFWQIGASGAVTACGASPANLPTSAEHNLDSDVANWGTYCEKTPTVRLENVTTPSIDGTSLRCTLTGGAPYSNVHCYRNLLPEPATSVFTLSLSFWFSPTTTLADSNGASVVQAIEFSLSKWHQSQRYEFALQWKNVGDGAPQWRYWDPHMPEPWISLGIPGALERGVWHALTLEGVILNGQVYYTQFSIDQHSHRIDRAVAPFPASGEPDRLAVAVQLDGNAKLDPYDTFIDRVNFLREPISAVHLPTVRR